MERWSREAVLLCGRAFEGSKQHDVACQGYGLRSNVVGVKAGYSIKGHDKHIKRFFFFVHMFANSVLDCSSSRGNLECPCQYFISAEEALE